MEKTMNKKVKIGITITAAMVVAVSALVIAAHVYYGNRCMRTPGSESMYYPE